MSPSDVTRATSIACEIRLATQRAEPSRALAHRLVIPEQAGCESQRDEGQLRRDLEVAEGSYVKQMVVGTAVGSRRRW